MVKKILIRIKRCGKKLEKKIKATKAYRKIQTIINASTFRRLYEQELERVEFFKEHADICSMKTARGELRGLQKNLTSFLVEVTDMLEEIDIHPFLCGGTLIGAIRHKGFIPWDDDLDLGITREEYYRLIDYAKEHWAVELYDGKWSKYTLEKHYERIDRCLKEHPAQWVLDICIDRLQIFRGTSVANRLCVALFPIDSFPIDYSFEEHLLYLRNLREQWHKIDYVDKVYDFMTTQIKQNPVIGGEEQYYFGIENQFAPDRKNDSFIPRNVIFPLKKIEFEGHEFWTPQDERTYISYEHKNYMEFPKDVGIKKHSYYDKYIEENLLGVDFYLVDSFEIAHFLPFYYEFKKRGVNVAFVCESLENGGGGWLDYKPAKEMLLDLGVKFREKANPKAAIAFTTQDAHNLSKYRGLKLHVSYGVSLYKKAFLHTRRITDGFDYCLMHGQFMKNYFAKDKSEDRIFIMGYPKHEAFWKADYKREDIYKELDIKPDKPVLLYFPTWDENASIQAYAKEMMKLKEKYYIITKAHHCTWRLESKKEDLDKLYAISDLVLEGNYDFRKSTLLGDVAICDAKSGACTEVGYLNPDLQLVLISLVENYHAEFDDEIDALGTVVTKPSELMSAVKKCFDTVGQMRRERDELNEFFYGDKTKNYVEEIVSVLLERVEKR